MKKMYYKEDVDKLINSLNEKELVALKFVNSIAEIGYTDLLALLPNLMAIYEECNLSGKNVGTISQSKK